MSYAENHYLSRDGLKLYYRDYGSGTNTNVLVCLPGLTRNCKDFEELAERLSSDWRVLSPDLRGRGQSQWAAKRSHYNPGRYVKDIWKLLDELAIEKAVVIGTSLGGLMAMIMADQQPHRLRGIVLNDIGPELPPGAVARILQYAGRSPPAEDWNGAAEQVRQAYELAYPNMPDDFWADFVHLSYRENAEGKPQPDMDPVIGVALRHPPSVLKLLQWLHRHGLVRRLGGVNIDPWDSFRSISMPCLLLHGAISDVLTADIVRCMKEAKPELQVVTVPARGHTPLLNEPMARSVIDDFLGQL